MRAVAGRCAGFDAVRAAAAGLVFFQHGCSVLDLDHWPEVAGVRIGRIGTAAFFALSGYLAGASRREPDRWLRDRAARLIPAYWVVTALAFAAAAATGTKDFDPGQVAAQFAGVGMLTHPGRMVYGITWFVTPLLFLYLLAALGMRRPWVMPLAAGGLLFAGLSNAPMVATAAALSFAFPVGFVAARAGRFRPTVLLAGAAVALLLCGMDPDLRYVALALPLLALATAWPAQWPSGAWFARYTWEWFLIHGLALHLVIWCGADAPAELFPAAAAVSLAAAVGLREGLDRATAFRLRRAPGRRIISLSSPPPVAPPPRVVSCSASSAARSGSATAPPAATSSSPAG